MKKSRKLICIEDTGRAIYGGGQRTTIYVIEKIKNLFNKIYIVDRCNSYKIYDYCRNNNLNYEAFNLSKYFVSFPKFFIKVLLIAIKIKDNKNIVIYTTTRLSTLAIGIVSKLISRRYKWIVHEHMIAPSNKTISYIYCKFLFSSDYQIFPSIHCKNSYEYNKLKEIKNSYIFGEEISSELPKNTDDDLIVRKKILAFEKKINRFDTIKIIYAGRISDEKGIFKLINMFVNDIKRVSKKDQNVTLFIAGFGNKKKIEKLKKSIKGNPMICYLGSINISQKFYSYFDLGINPSWGVNESLGLSALEILKYNGKLLTSECKSLKGIEKYGGFLFFGPKDNIYKKIKEINLINKSDYKYINNNSNNFKKLKKIFY